MIKDPKSVKNSMFVCVVQATPTCQPFWMTNKDPLDVQSSDHMTLATLDLIEINILHTLELSVAAA